MKSQRPLKLYLIPFFARPLVAPPSAAVLAIRVPWSARLI